MQVNNSGGTSGLSVLSPLVDLGLGGLQFGPHSTLVQTMQTKHCRMFLKYAVQIFEFFFSRNQALANRP
jgi:hypothetical protein